MRVLLVEDDAMLGKALSTGLVQAGYTPDWLTDGESADEAIKANSYAAVILDINLPGISGLELLKALRRTSDLPVIIMTARDGLDARIEGLDLGADDYIVKPFALSELLARLRAVHRRSQGRSQSVIVLGNIEIDTGARTVRKDGEWLKLTAREFQILELLTTRTGRILSKSDIEAQIYSWDGDYESNTIEAAIYTLRKKIGRDLITTIRGVGYVVNP
ncbi:response regulator transcription factor [Asticcacaulis sp. 201]|uniref:response regulator transcription factor n=1 Tax=Asticcacaulis sp. 201 TaxID=3028787 RepID=UPI002916C985|nr:response regulator transcription factor [Asticcacaulis sp. 201]MDV6330645.1 response regulator transcription factor [Asticcacaulis sp. 201]